jgi:hypothetical protein
MAYCNTELSFWSSQVTQILTAAGMYPVCLAGALVGTPE